MCITSRAHHSEPNAPLRIAINLMQLLREEIERVVTISPTRCQFDHVLQLELAENFNEV